MAVHVECKAQYINDTKHSVPTYEMKTVSDCNTLNMNTKYIYKQENVLLDLPFIGRNQDINNTFFGINDV